MGLTTADIKILGSLKRRGIPFGRTLTLGRQWVMPTHEELVPLLRSFGIDEEKIHSLKTTKRAYAEPLLNVLGATRVDSLDYSDFEGATKVHDLNKPLPEALKAQFDLVIDGGTLEHVFNVPEAFRSFMELATLNGYVYTAVPANNLCGHGFYQFSPEFMFRVFSPENGFTIEQVIFYEAFHRRDFRTGEMRMVIDPAELGYRPALDAGCPMVVATLAKRTAIVPIFATPPLQSDYVTTWKENNRANSDDKVSSGQETIHQPGIPIQSKARQRVLDVLDDRFPHLMSAVRTCWNPLNSRLFYRRTDLR